MLSTQLCNVCEKYVMKPADSREKSPSELVGVSQLLCQTQRGKVG